MKQTRSLCCGPALTRDLADGLLHWCHPCSFAPCHRPSPGCAGASPDPPAAPRSAARSLPAQAERSAPLPADPARPPARPQPGPPRSPRQLRPPPLAPAQSLSLGRLQPLSRLSHDTGRWLGAGEGSRSSRTSASLPDSRALRRCPERGGGERRGLARAHQPAGRAWRPLPPPQPPCRAAAEPRTHRRDRRCRAARSPQHPWPAWRRRGRRVLAPPYAKFGAGAANFGPSCV